MFKDNLARILSELKKSKKISQAQIARFIGVTPSNITEWLKGRSSPSPEKITKLAEVLGVAVSDLIDEPPSGTTTISNSFNNSFNSSITINGQKNKPSEADQEFSKLSEEDKRLALSFLKFIKENNLTRKE